MPTNTRSTAFHSQILRPGVAARTATGNAITCVRSFAATVDWLADDGVSRPVATTLYVLENLQQPVLCSETQRKLGMLRIKYPHARINHITSRPTFQPSEAQKEADLATLMAEVPRVFDGVCRVMAGPPCHFVLKVGAVPVKIRGSRPISKPLRVPFRDELAGKLKQGIMRKVRPEEVTPWIHRVVVVPKNRAAFSSAPTIARSTNFSLARNSTTRRPFNRCVPSPKE